MNKKYVSLSENFTVKHSTSTSILYCLRNGAIYELLSDQVEFLQLLNGTSTMDQIVEQYFKESRRRVLMIFEQLRSISALKLTDKPALRVLRQDKAPETRLESVHLEASGRCNMRCVHCYQAKYVKTGEELSFTEIIRLLDDLQTMQVNNVGISGGEPLMMAHLGEVLAAIENRDMRVSALFSNGLLINNDFVEMIKARRSQFSLFISLDSIPNGNLSFRGISENDSRSVLNTIIENIKLLVSNGRSVVINTVVNTENIKHLSEMYELISDLGVDSWRIGFPKMTPEFKGHSETFNVEWNNIAESCLVLLKRHLKNSMPFHLQIEYLFREELFKQGLQMLSGENFVCDYEGRRSECCVKPNGDVVSCAYCSDLPVGNIRKSSIRDIWYSSEMEKIKRIRIADVIDCKKCNIRNLCGTGCRANAFFLHGDFNNSKDDYACLAVEFFKEKVVPLLKEYGLVKQSFSP
jgi:radical SAM protein with 4Fe4S-binding SPASM domain